MPRPTRERKSNVSLEGANIQGPGQGSTLNQHVYFQRPSGRETAKFLENLTNYVGKRQLQKAGEEAAESAQRSTDAAHADILAGTIKPELLQEDPVYREAVNSIQGETKAYRFRKELNLRAAEVLAQDPQADMEEFFQNESRSFLENPEFGDPDFARAADEQLMLARQEIGLLGMGAAAKAADEEAVLTAVDYVSADLDSGLFDEGAFSSKARDLALTPNEQLDVKIEAITQFAARATDLEQFDNVAGQIKASMSKRQKDKFQEDLNGLRRQVESRTKVDAVKADIRDSAEVLNLRVENEDRITAAIEAGRVDDLPTDRELRQLTERGVYSDSEGRTVRTKVIRARRDIAQAAITEQRNISVVKDPASFYTLSGEQQSEVKEYYTGISKSFTGTINETLRGFSDPAADRGALRSQLQTDLLASKYVITQGQEMGMTNPTVARLNAASSSSVGNMEGLYELYQASQATGMPLKGLTDEAEANLNTFGRHLEYTSMSPAEVQAAMADRLNGMSRGQARAFVSQQLDIPEDTPPAQRALLEELATTAYHRDPEGDLDAALEWAEERVAKTHTEVDGNLIPATALKEGFAEEWDEGKDLFTKALVASELLDEGTGIRLVPTTGFANHGTFQIITDDHQFVVDAAGSRMVIRSNDILGGIALAKRRETVAQQRLANDINKVAADRQAAGEKNLPIQTLGAQLAAEAFLGMFHFEKATPEVATQLRRGTGLVHQDKYGYTPSDLDYSSAVRSVLETPRTPTGDTFQEVTPEVNDDDLLQLVAHGEGYKDTAYTDTTGHLTVGYGSNLEAPHIREQAEKLGIDVDAVINDGMPITRAEGIALLKAGIAQAEKDIRQLVPNFEGLPRGAQHVLVDMSYNLGLTRLSGFKRMLAAITGDPPDFQKAADEMVDSDWYEQVGKRSIRLEKLMRQQS